MQIANMIVKKCQIRLKKVLKRFAGNEKVATFASAMRSKRSLKRKETGSEKFLKNSCKKIWRKEKLVLPLHPLSPRNEIETKATFLKKSCKNIWKLKKRALPLQSVRVTNPTNVFKMVL